MSIIYHITRREQWDASQPGGVYRGDTLDTEGFIHCSTRAQVLSTAAAYFKGVRGLVLLEIDETRVHPEIHYEGTPGGKQFPHIYGPLNLDAVDRVLLFEPESDGRFVFPG